MTRASIADVFASRAVDEVYEGKKTEMEIIESLGGNHAPLQDWSDDEKRPVWSYVYRATFSDDSFALFVPHSSVFLTGFLFDSPDGILVEI